MNIRNVVLLAAVIVIAVSSALSQTSPGERKAFNEYTSPEELVSIAPSTSFDRAITALSEVSQKFTGKVIIDTGQRTLPIGVDVQAMQWRTALELICRTNNLWYSEHEKYLQITSLTPKTGGTGKGGEEEENPPTFSSRELKISAVFFEVNLTRLDEVGVNWSFMKSTPDYTLDLVQTAGDKVTAPIFEAGLTPHLSFANIDVVARMFSSHDLGEVLSGPQIVVRSGEQGSIQVGQDFSIKERDFAGNLIDKFYHAGTIIEVTPLVITEQGVDFVHLDVRVERSNVQPGTVSTIVNKTEAVTQLLLLNDEETVIGGLYNNETSTIRQGIPGLKDLPPWFFGLRYLFGYDKDQITKKELVILVKAEIIPSLQERITQKVSKDRIFDEWLKERQEQENRIRGNKK